MQCKYACRYDDGQKHQYSIESAQKLNPSLAPPIKGKKKQGKLGTLAEKGKPGTLVEKVMNKKKDDLGLEKVRSIVPTNPSPAARMSERPKRDQQQQEVQQQIDTAMAHVDATVADVKKAIVTQLRKISSRLPPQRVACRCSRRRRFEASVRKPRVGQMVEDGGEVSTMIDNHEPMVEDGGEVSTMIDNHEPGASVAMDYHVIGHRPVLGDFANQTWC